MAKNIPGGTTYQLNPKRRIGWKVFLLLIAATIGGHQWWASHEQRQLAAEVDSLRRHGEPMSLRDFRTSPASGTDNAAADLLVASSIVEQARDDMNELRYPDPPTPPFTSEQAMRLRRLVDCRRDALHLVGAASAKPAIDWGLSFDSPVVLRSLRDMRLQLDNLATFMGYAVLVAHHDGDDAEALRLVREMLFLSRAVDEQPTLASHCTATSIAGQATRRLGQIIPTIRAEALRDGGAEHVRTLIAELLDADTPRGAAQRAIRGERAWQQDSLHALLDGTLSFAALQGRRNDVSLPDRIARAVTEPTVYSDGRMLLRHAGVAIHSLDAPDRPTARVRIAPIEAERDAQAFLLHLFAVSAAPRYERFVGQHYIDLANRRVAATALAARWYAAENGGGFPASLDSLVPSHLPAVPYDPLARAKPIGYLRDAPGPRVYSVGDNGQDDAGHARPGTGPWSPDTYDLVIYLSSTPQGATIASDVDAGIWY